jgi:hypothetical protein
LIIALAIPTILELVPRNRIYGFRTPYTMSSDAVWYRANRLSGFAFLVAGLFWLAAGLLAPLVAPSPGLGLTLDVRAWHGVDLNRRRRFVLVGQSRAPDAGAETMTKTRPRWMQRHTTVNLTLVAAVLLFVVWATFAR